jgi:hypothetical protein
VDLLRLIRSLSNALARSEFLKDRFEPLDAGNSTLWVLRSVPNHIKLYYRYCLLGLLRELNHQRGKREVVLCFAKHVDYLPSRAQAVVIQHEHTLLDINHPQDGAWASNLVDDSGMPSHLVRLLGPTSGFEKAHGIIDYSSLNIAHVSNSEKGKFYGKKAHYIAPLLGNPQNRNRQKGPPRVTTMFGSPDLGRRKDFIDQLNQVGVFPSNIKNFENYEVAFSNSEVLVNVRQFGHLQTPEELRLLPALLQQVLIFSEDAPLHELVKYSDFLVLGSFAELPARLEEGLKFFDHYWESVFGAKSHFDEMVWELKQANLSNFAALVN